MNTREWAIELLDGSSVLRALGLPESNVFDADTADSPETKPFIVLRWGEETDGMGHARRFPLDIWVYDNSGDHGRAAGIADAAALELQAAVPCQVPDSNNGWVTHVDTRGAALGRGGDLRDDGFDALVVPYHTRVVTTAG